MNARMAFTGYECHLDIPPNQRRIRVWNSAGMNALLAFPGHSVDYAENTEDTEGGFGDFKVYHFYKCLSDEQLLSMS